MSRTANPDIGTINCPITGDSSPVRRYRTGQRLAYFCSKAGQIKPNLEQGQLFIYQNAVFNDPEDKRQIGQWLASRGIPINSEIEPEPAPEITPEKPAMVETVIGAPIAAEPEPVPEPQPAPTPARSPSILDRFLQGDDE